MDRRLSTCNSLLARHAFVAGFTHATKGHLLPVTIILYSKQNCPGCTATKRRLEKLRLAYTEKRVDEDPVALAHIKGLGYSQAPVIELSTNRSWSGFRPDLIETITESA